MGESLFSLALVMMGPLALEQGGTHLDVATNHLSQRLLRISQLSARPRAESTMEEKRWPALATLAVASRLVVVSVPTSTRQIGRQVLSQSICLRIHLHQVLHPDVGIPMWLWLASTMKW